MDILSEHFHQMNRRHFLSSLSLGLGSAALGSLLGCNATGQPAAGPLPGAGILDKLHFAPKAKRVIYLFQSGGPSQMELFDYKPLLWKMNGEELPESVRNGQRLTGMTAGQSSFPLAAPIFDFKQRGQSGAWVSDLMPHTAEIVDDLCFIKTMHTEAINHDPAITFFQTGSQQPGRPSIGSWLSYGLGSDNQNLPTFIVLLSRGAQRPQPIYSRLWGNGFLASLHQGVQFRAGNDPVLFLNNPDGMDSKTRRDVLDHLNQLNTMRLQDFGDPEIESRIAQYEMAYRMQTSVPEALDLSDEPDSTFDMYGEDARKPGTYAANCLLARRLAERDVKFVQLYHLGWDQHEQLPREISSQCRDTDQASAALVKDLKQRGLLEDTLVVWGGEFGRTNYSQGKLTADNYGRDHHPRCFTIWMAGGGTKPGITYGETDDFSYNIVKDPVHVHDFQATLLHLLGVDHERLTFKHQGRRYRLTDVEGKLVKGILA
uniref:DUF1501 domain-containing protein n=1 Tax=Roseihalotalea indica TaxID=2867963 RepID=A0AA49JI28_9BACT|nr:DUF1501 domain-containing protein [Tunicatimonas sp. TK19036]